MYLAGGMRLREAKRDIARPAAQVEHKAALGVARELLREQFDETLMGRGEVGPGIDRGLVRVAHQFRFEDAVH